MKLSQNAQKIYKKLSAKYPDLDEQQKQILALHCNSLADYWELTELIRAEGWSVPSTVGSKPNPLCAVRKQAFDAAEKTAKLLPKVEHTIDDVGDLLGD